MKSNLSVCHFALSFCRREAQAECSNSEFRFRDFWDRRDWIRGHRDRIHDLIQGLIRDWIEDLIQYLIRDLIQDLIQDLIRDWIEDLIQDFLDPIQDLIQHLIRALIQDMIRGLIQDLILN